jgi:hypothetical protein
MAKLKPQGAPAAWGNISTRSPMEDAKKRELRQQWQRACKLILAKADVFAVSRALELELALFMDAKLDVSKGA